jgi:protein-tyrosine phosphatase
VYRHPNGACFFIGNQSIASNKEALKNLKIFKIVNCQEPQAKNVHENDPYFEYMRPNFSISLWQYNPKNRTPEGLLEYMSNLFQWVDQRLDKGHNVMVHCLAGAHRAGTAGTAYVMYKGGLDKKSALTAVQACRPFVDPIYDFKDLLEILEVALRSRNAPRSSVANSGASRPSQSGLGR